MGPSERYSLLIESRTSGEGEIAKLERAVNKILDQSSNARKEMEATGQSARQLAVDVGLVVAAGKALQETVQITLALGRAYTEARGRVGVLVDAYRGVRLAVAAAAGETALYFTGATIGATLLAEKLLGVANAYTRVVEKSALVSARGVGSFQSVQAFTTASVISGRDLSFLNGFNPDKVRDYIRELEKIADPIDRAKRATEVFGADASKVYALLGTGISKQIEQAQELTAELDGPTRASVQKLRDTFQAFENFNPFAAISERLRLLREEARQGITIKIAALVERVEALGNRLPSPGEGSGVGAEGGVTLDSGDRPGLGIPSLDEFRRMLPDVIGTSPRFKLENGVLTPSASLLPSANRGGLGLARAFRSGAGQSEDSVLIALREVQENREKLRRILGTPGLGDADFKDIESRIGKLAVQEDALRFRAEQIAKARKGATLFVDSSTFITPLGTRAPSLRKKNLSLENLPEFVSTEADRNRFPSDAGLLQAGASAALQQQKDQRERALNTSFAQQFIAFEERKIALLSGPGGELEAINKIYELKKAGLEQELQFGSEIFNLTERRLQIEQEKTLELLNFQRQRKLEARGLASDFVGSIQVGDPRTFFRQQGGRLLNQIGTNALEKPVSKLLGTLGQFGASSGLGGLLKGTLFDPQNATPVDKNTAATDRNTAAIERLTAGAGLGRAGVAIPGFPGIFASDLNGITGAGPIINTPGKPAGILANFTAGLGSVGTAGLFSGLRGQDRSIQLAPGVATTPAGLGIDSTASRVANTTASVAAIGISAKLAYDGFKRGGASGILQGASAALGGAALIPGPQQPFIAAAAATAALIGMLLPDPKKQREGRIDRTLESAQYISPAAMNYAMTTNGEGFDYNRFGALRPIIINQNINALDAKNVIDRRADIAEATRQAMQEAHPLNDEIRGMVAA